MFNFNQSFQNVSLHESDIGYITICPETAMLGVETFNTMHNAVELVLPFYLIRQVLFWILVKNENQLLMFIVNITISSAKNNIKAFK